MEKFLNTLIKWYIKNKRELPWRQTTDPYKIWLSEIILQQTRVEQGMPYYEKFIIRYPTLMSLAKASDDEVMKLWQGLGYYNRARNMLFTARFLMENHNGEFPKEIEEIKGLKGIGDYTAAAIGSFAFNIKEPVLDGNVYRFITRLFGIESPVDSIKTKRSVLLILNEWIKDTKDPATFNQAMMEFGALQCTPNNPICESCPFLSYCYAFKEKKTNLIPVKAKPILVRSRYLNYFVIVSKNKYIYLKKREEKDIWQNLYDFPLIETPKPVTLKMIQNEEEFLKLTNGIKIQRIALFETVIHKLSHQKLFVTFYIVNISKFLNLENSPIFDIEINTINSFAVPRVIEKFLHGINFKTLLKTF